MKIAVIGAGNVGGTLGKRWAQAGHSVVFGVRNPADDKLKPVLAAAGPNARAVTLSEAAAGSEVVVLTVPWGAAEEALRNLGDLRGKLLVDAMNPLRPGPDGRKLELALGYTTSAGEQVAAWAPGARVVKAFNTTGFGNMNDPKYGAEAATMFFCGDDAGAKETVKRLGEDLGFEMIDAGPLAAARMLEPLAMLWINLALFEGFGPNIAFKLMRR